MRRSLQIGAVLVVVAAIAAMVLVARQYRSDRNSYERVYTETVKQRDISDSARNAISALQDAVLQAQSYVLTGETSYSEAYAHDIRDWQDEFATLELLSPRDASAPVVQDLSRSATRVLGELALIVSVYDGGSRDAALDRIHKGSGVVYLEQARELVAKIQQLDGLAADEANRSLTGRILAGMRRLAAAAVFLGCLALAGIFLLSIQFRLRQPGTGEKRAAADAGASR